MTSAKAQKASQLLPLPLVSLNHVSFSCASLKDSIQFYQEVLGFQLIKRPSSLHFPGAWLYNYGLGIHLLQRSSDNNAPIKPSAINPNDSHISFQCEDVEMIKKKLTAMQIQYVSAIVEDGEKKRRRWREERAIERKIPSYLAAFGFGGNRFKSKKRGGVSGRGTGHSTPVSCSLLFFNPSSTVATFALPLPFHPSAIATAAPFASTTAALGWKKRFQSLLGGVDKE